MSGTRSSFRAIRDEMARRIAERLWLPGALIPGEEVLAREFGAARATVNRALQELARAGLVERRRRAGTRVALHPVREARFVIPLVRQEIEARGAEYQYRLLSREEASPPEVVRARLGLDVTAPFFHVRCLHLADRLPYQFEDRWISLDVVPAARRADFEDVSPNEWLVEHAPFTDAEFTFRAAAASAEEAAVMQLREGEPVFVGERITWLGERPITLVRMVHPSSHRMVTRL
ncbi:GntR family transcriptional regulator [Chelativorans salis]|uniref:GntR family transcriptional regulator n=1 Tax=Chelativorans salis TaxID=2978478 RepID=A0ABT2LNK8_9HYPH|nr:GntR family transcriptional regulator [Chelativorans sp. EGI FJ00035]MCT7376150.1 GntR family transcriptional regulator [Chelativorans sp. EGI FJ00035]